MNWADLYGAAEEPRAKGVAVLSAGRAAAKAEEIAQAIGCYVRKWDGGDLAAFLEEAKPEIVLLSDRAALDPILRWAQKKSLPVIGPCLDVQVDPSTREAIGRRAVLGGRMIAEMSAGKLRPQIFFL